MNLDDLQKLKDRLYDSPDLIDSFVKDNPENLASEELEIVSAWKNFVRGRFYIVRHLKNYTIFLDSSHPPRAYGVLGIISSLEEMMGPNLPRIVDATLLPFKDQIIYDGTLSSFNIISSASGIRRSIDDSYRQAKEHGNNYDSARLFGRCQTERFRDTERISKNPSIAGTCIMRRYGN